MKEIIDNCTFKSPVQNFSQGLTILKRNRDLIAWARCLALSNGDSVRAAVTVAVVVVVL